MNPLDWVANGVQKAIDFLIGDFINWLVGVMLESINALYDFNPIDMNADWWRSSYAYAAYFGVVAAFIISIYKLVAALYRREIRSIIGAATLWLRTFAIATFIPVMYGMALETSNMLREAAKFGQTPSQMYGNLDLFKGLGLWGGVIFVFPMVVVALVTWIEVVTIQFMTYIIFVGGGFYYGLKDAGGFGLNLWKKTLAFSFVSVVGPPVAIAIQSLGYLATSHIQMPPMLQTLNPQALLLLIILGAAAFIPIKMLGWIKPAIDAHVTSGSLQKAGKTQTTMRKSSGGRGILRVGGELYAEHRLDLLAMERAHKIRMRGDPHAVAMARPKYTPGVPGGVLNKAAVTAGGPWAGAAVAGASVIDKARKRSARKKGGGK
jgi:hypothetical protein